MDKQLFDKYEGLLYCESCKMMVPKKHMNPRRVKPGFVLSKCNVDMWLDRHKSLSVLDGFSLQETKAALHHFLYDDICILNDISNELNRSIDEIIRLYEYLNIKGKQILIRTSCEYCGETTYKSPRAYKVAQNNYCDFNCYAQDKVVKMSGENNPNYKRISSKCSMCGKDILVIPFDYNKTNSYGDNHNFCSQKCYWDFRGKYYVKEKTYTYHHEYTDKEREAMRNGFLRYLSSADRLNTKPQLIVDDILSSLGIDTKREEVFDFYSVDNYLPSYHGVIEVMGDYWHSNPYIYGPAKKMNSIQEKQIHRDKLKISYFLKKKMPVLYLWESDIYNDIALCRELIAKYVKSLELNESLLDYQSFNWILDDRLHLKDFIVIPYQFRNISEYRDFFISQNV